MPWFMVDDGFHAHKKAVRAGTAALGLWVLAGSWCADQLSDGWIPDYIASRLDPDYMDHAHALVRAGLWCESEEEGEKGWRFHEWEQIQRTKAEVLEKRQEAKDRMARVRAKRARSSGDVRANTSRTDSEPNENFARSSDSVRSTPALPSPALPINPMSAFSTADATNERPDVDKVCEHLAAAVEANGSKRPEVTKRWRDSARLMLDKDGRAVDQVIRAIDWCQADEFWRGNVLSMPKLRDKYDQLRLAAQRSSTARGVLPPSTSPEVIPESEKCEHRRRAVTCGLCRAEQKGVNPNGNN